MCKYYLDICPPEKRLLLLFYILNLKQTIFNNQTTELFLLKSNIWQLLYLYKLY